MFFSCILKPFFWIAISFSFNSICYSHPNPGKEEESSDDDQGKREKRKDGKRDSSPIKNPKHPRRENSLEFLASPLLHGASFFNEETLNSGSLSPLSGPLSPFIPILSDLHIPASTKFENPDEELESILDSNVFLIDQLSPEILTAIDTFLKKHPLGSSDDQLKSSIDDFLKSNYKCSLSSSCLQDIIDKIELEQPEVKSSSTPALKTLTSHITIAANSKETLPHFPNQHLTPTLLAKPGARTVSPGLNLSRSISPWGQLHAVPVNEDKLISEIKGYEQLKCLSSILNVPNIYLNLQHIIIKDIDKVHNRNSILDQLYKILEKDSFPVLRSLVLPNTNAGSPFVKRVANTLSKITSLTILDVSQAFATCEAMEELIKNLFYLPELKVLDISDNNNFITATRALADNLNCIQNLEALYCSNTYAAGEVLLSLFDKIHQLKKLKTLDISFNNAGLTAKYLASKFCQISELEKLDLSGNNIQKAGMKAVATNLKSLPKLQMLCLEDNQGTEFGAKAIAMQLKHLPLLQEFHFWSNNLNPELCKVILEALSQLKDIQVIHLYSTFDKDQFKNAVRLLIKHYFKQKVIEQD